MLVQACGTCSPTALSRTAGASEKTLKRLDIPYKKVYIHANQHAGYYPGAKTIDLKLLFCPQVILSVAVFGAACMALLVVVASE